MHDEVRLVMPADPEFLRLARVTAMGMATRLAFTLDAIEDLRIAIDELVIALIGPKGRAGDVRLQYTLVDDGLEILGWGDFDESVPAAVLTDLSQMILDAVTDEHSVSNNGGPSFRLLKRRG